MRILTGRPEPQRGFSLIELMIAITLVGILLAIAMPRVQGATIRRNTEAARAALVNLYAQARLAAIQSRRTVTLNIDGTSAWITAPRAAGGLDTLGAVANLHNQFGVNLAPSGNVTVLPTGLVNAGTPINLKVTKSGQSDSVVISGYGRLQ